MYHTSCACPDRQHVFSIKTAIIMTIAKEEKMVGASQAFDLPKVNFTELTAKVHSWYQNLCISPISVIMSKCMPRFFCSALAVRYKFSSSQKSSVKTQLYDEDG